MKKTKECKICYNETSGTETCSHSHGMLYRYLKNTTLPENEYTLVWKETENIADVKPSVRLECYINGINEISRCNSCGKEYVNIKMSKYCCRRCEYKEEGRGWTSLEEITDIKNKSLISISNIVGNKYTHKEIHNFIYGTKCCIRCGSEARFISLTKGYDNYCSVECNDLYEKYSLDNIFRLINSDYKFSGYEFRMISKYHNISKSDIYKYRNPDEGVCEVCGKLTTFRYIGVGFNRTCSYKCSNTIPRRKLTYNEIIAANKKRENTNNAKYGVPFIFNTYTIEHLSKIRTTNENNNRWLPLNLHNDKQLYYYLVDKITRQQDLNTLVNYEYRGNVGYNIGAYHLDHMYSKKDGFVNCILPYYVGHICNLEFLPAIVNINKRDISSHTINKLIEKVTEYEATKN